MSNLFGHNQFQLFQIQAVAYKLQYIECIESFSLLHRFQCSAYYEKALSLRTHRAHRWHTQYPLLNYFIQILLQIINFWADCSETYGMWINKLNANKEVTVEVLFMHKDTEFFT